MTAKKARTRDGQISGYGKPRAHPILAAQPRRQRDDEEKRCNVSDERVNRTDPAFGA